LRKQSADDVRTSSSWKTDDKFQGFAREILGMTNVGGKYASQRN
jgi:hypothetical protein